MLTAAGTGHAQSFSGEALVKALQKGGASSFHQHFKAVKSPLQFQKVLRLQEARRLMFSTMMDVNTAKPESRVISARLNLAASIAAFSAVRRPRTSPGYGNMRYLLAVNLA